MSEKTGWENEGVETIDEQCPIHGENAVWNCWPCHVAAVYAGLELCEPIDEEA